MRRADVVGAGVFGLATATELVERGFAVTVWERNADLTGGASWLAGGMLAPFCEGESASASVVERGQGALDWWDRHVSDVARQGTLVVAPPRDAADLERFAARTRAFERLDEEGIAALEPDLAGRFRRGLFFAREGHVDPRRAMEALARRLVERGATLRFGEAFLSEGPAAPSAPSPLAGEGWGEGVFRLGRPSPTRAAPLVIDTRGYAARDALPTLRGVRGEMLIVRSHEVRLSRPVRLLHPRIPLYVAPRADGVFMIGATMIESAEAGGATARSVIELLSAAFALHPAFGEAEVVEMHAGVRPAYADNEPRVVVGDGRIFVNGAYRHGFLLAPDMARAAADAVSALVD
jgi:glycine oxidase